MNSMITTGGFQWVRSVHLKPDLGVFPSERERVLGSIRCEPSSQPARRRPAGAAGAQITRHAGGVRFP